MRLIVCGDADKSAFVCLFIMFYSSLLPSALGRRATMATAACAVQVCFGLEAWAQEQPVLPPVIVSGSRMPELLQSAPIGASVITAEQIQRSGVSDANEAIRRLGGVAGKSDLFGGREYTLDMRGYGDGASANTVVMVDGLRVSENELTPARLSAIPLDQIDRIEIVRSGASVLWGEGATGGVINVILKHNAQAGSSARLTATVESFGGHELQANGTQKIGAVLVDGSVRRLRSQGYRDRSKYEQDSGSLGVLWAQDHWTQRLRVQHEQQDAQWPGYLTFAQFEANPRQGQTGRPDDHGSTEETRWSSHTEYKLDDLSAQLDLGARERQTDSWSSGFAYGRSVRSQQATPKLSHQAAWGAVKANTIVGFDLQHWTLDAASQFGTDSGRQTNRALFVHSDWTFPSATRIAIGGRTERIVKQQKSDFTEYDRRDSLKAFDLGVSQGLTQDWTLYGRLAQSYRLPNFDENGATPGSLPLQPQRGRDKEVGMRWSKTAGAVSARYFQQNNVDEIMYVPAFPFGSNENVAPTRRRGVELEGQWNPWSYLELRMTWQHLSARYKSGVNGGKEQVLVAPQTGTLRASYQVTERQTVAAGLQYLAAMRFGDDVSNQCARKIPKSILLDARYAWSDKVWTVAVSGTNLSDHQGYNYAYSCTTGALYPEAGRAFKLAVSRQF